MSDAQTGSIQVYFFVWLKPDFHFARVRQEFTRRSANYPTASQTAARFRLAERREQNLTTDYTATPEPAAPQPLDAWFLELLACPGCEQRLPVHLNAAQDALDCACGRYAYPIRDGIPVLLVDEATLLDENAKPGGNDE